MERTRTGDGFPDWEIVAGAAGWWRLRDTSELLFEQDGHEWRLGVDDRTGLVIRAARDNENGRETWLVGSARFERSLVRALSNVPGLVRVTYGPGEGGHVEHYVAREATGVEY